MKEVILALISDFSWPLITLIVLCVLRTEISKLLGRLSTLKAGSVELQLHEQISAQGLSEKQLKQLAKLSVGELDLFLLVSFSEDSGFNYRITTPPDIFKRRLKSLEAAGLLKIINSENDGSDMRHDLTEEGKTLRYSLLSSSTQLLRKSAST